MPTQFPAGQLENVLSPRVNQLRLGCSVQWSTSSGLWLLLELRDEDPGVGPDSPEFSDPRDREDSGTMADCCEAPLELGRL